MTAELIYSDLQAIAGNRRESKTRNWVSGNGVNATRNEMINMMPHACSTTHC